MVVPRVCHKKKHSFCDSLTHGIKGLKLKKRMATHVRNLDRENGSLYDYYLLLSFRDMA